MKLAKWSSVPDHFRISLPSAIVGHRAGGRVAGHEQAAAFAMDVDADVAAEELVHVLRAGLVGQAADFEDQRRRRIVVEHDLGVRRLAVVHVAQPPADAPHARRQFVDAQEPAGQVHLVNALVADVAVAGGPDPMPIVVQTLAASAVPWAPDRTTGRSRSPAEWAGARTPCRCCRGACSRCRGPTWILPRLPARTHSTACATPSRDERLCVPVCTMRLYRRAAFTACRPSQTLCETGFSTYTSLPAWQPQTTTSECQ